MKKLALAALAISAAVSAQANTDAGAKNFSAAFWAPDSQMVPANQDVSGVRLQVYGENKNVTGADIGFAHSVTGDMNGSQGFNILPIPSIYGYVGGKLNGAQFSIVNQYGSEVNGAQLGLVNYSRATEAVLNGAQLSFVNLGCRTEVYGAQLGFVNTAKTVHGVQFGFVNITEHLYGVQLGLWNQVSSRGWGEFKPLPKVFPFINLGW